MKLKNDISRVKKSYFLLLEVMIAFGLIVLCVLPLIYPHTYILRAQKEFIQEVELDHYVNSHFADLVELLYKNQVPWDVISGKQTIPLNPPKLPFKGTLQFEELKSKPEDSPTYEVYLFEITYRFTNDFTYTYHLMIIRDLTAEKMSERLEDNQEDANEKS
jgi:hypothetical protein